MGRRYEPVLAARLAAAVALHRQLPGPYQWKINAWLLDSEHADGAEKPSRINPWAHPDWFAERVITQIHRAWRASTGLRKQIEETEPW